MSGYTYRRSASERGPRRVPARAPSRSAATADVLSFLLQRFTTEHQLSPRETALLGHAVQGLNNDEAAELLGCGRATVTTYWKRIFDKTHWHSQRDVIAYLLRYALAELEPR